MKKSVKIFLRVLMLIAAVLLVIFYIGPVITVGEMNIGIITGFALAALLVVYSVFFNKINALFGKICSVKKGKIAVSVVGTVLCACIAVAGVAFSSVVANSHADSYKSDVIIVLGCKVNGENPGPFLKSRINAAYKYLNENPESIAVLSGGKGKGEAISEAECMYKYLVKMGVDKSRLIVEDSSTSTMENFKNSAAMLKAQNRSVKDITVVTNDFHEYRAGKFAQRCGFSPHSYPSKTPWNGYMPFATREVFAIVYQVYLK